MNAQALKKFVEENKERRYTEIQILEDTYPMIVMKLVVKEPSEKRKSRQLLPTPAILYRKNKLVNTWIHIRRNPITNNPTNQSHNMINHLVRHA